LLRAPDHDAAAGSRPAGEVGRAGPPAVRLLRPAGRRGELSARPATTAESRQGDGRAALSGPVLDGAPPDPPTHAAASPRFGPACRLHVRADALLVRITRGAADGRADLTRLQ